MSRNSKMQSHKQVVTSALFRLCDQILMLKEVGSAQRVLDCSQGTDPRLLCQQSRQSSQTLAACSPATAAFQNRKNQRHVAQLPPIHWICTDLPWLCQQLSCDMPQCPAMQGQWRCSFISEPHLASLSISSICFLFKLLRAPEKSVEFGLNPLFDVATKVQHQGVPGWWHYLCSCRSWAHEISCGSPGICAMHYTIYSSIFLQNVPINAHNCP